MPNLRITDSNKRVVAIIDLPAIYRYKGFTFEEHYLGPIKCNKDGNPSKAPEGRKFYKTYAEWSHLPPSKRKRTQIYP